MKTHERKRNELSTGAVYPGRSLAVRSPPGPQSFQKDPKTRHPGWIKNRGGRHSLVTLPFVPNVSVDEFFPTVSTIAAAISAPS
jgi:hypothetical protein